VTLFNAYWRLHEAILNCHYNARSFSPKTAPHESEQRRSINHHITGEHSKTSHHCPTGWRNSSIHSSRNGHHSLCIHFLFVFCLFICLFSSRIKPRFQSQELGSADKWAAGTTCCSSTPKFLSREWETGSAGGLLVHPVLRRERAWFSSVVVDDDDDDDDGLLFI